MALVLIIGDDRNVQVGHLQVLVTLCESVLFKFQMIAAWRTWWKQWTQVQRILTLCQRFHIRQ